MPGQKKTETTPNRQEDKKMKNNELKLNEMELASGGNLIDDVKDFLQKIFPNPLDRLKPYTPDFQGPENIRVKC